MRPAGKIGGNIEHSSARNKHPCLRLTALATGNVLQRVDVETAVCEWFRAFFEVGRCVGATMNRSFKLTPSTVHETFSDETVVMNLTSGSYYSLCGTSSVIWTMLVDGATEWAMVRRIEADYAAGDDEVPRSIQEFLDLLVAENLLVSHVAQDLSQPLGTPLIPASVKAFTPPILEKFTDMEEMLLLDPIHEVDEEGWPMARKDREP
jgi:hypothetical protein